MNESHTLESRIPPQFAAYVPRPSEWKVKLGLTFTQANTLMAIMSYELVYAMGPSRKEVEAFCLPHSMASALVALYRCGFVKSYILFGRMFLHTTVPAWEFMGFEPPQHLKEPDAYVVREKAA